MNASEIAEIVCRMRDKLVSLGVSENAALLQSAEAAVEELLRPPTAAELAEFAAFGSYVGSEALRKIGEHDAKCN